MTSEYTGIGVYTGKSTRMLPPCHNGHPHSPILLDGFDRHPFAWIRVHSRLIAPHRLDVTHATNIGVALPPERMPLHGARTSPSVHDSYPERTLQPPPFVADSNNHRVLEVE